MRITFRKNPYSIGRMRIPKGFRVNCNGETVAHIQIITGAADAWFWYGDGQNTYRTPMSLDECKAAVIAYFKAKTDRHSTTSHGPCE